MVQQIPFGQIRTSDIRGFGDMTPEEQIKTMQWANPAGFGQPQQPQQRQGNTMGYGFSSGSAVGGGGGTGFDPYSGLTGYLNNNLLGGIGTMNNLGNTIGQGFGLANMLSSANMQAKYAPEAQLAVAQTNANAQRDIEKMKLDSLKSIMSPFMSQLANGGMGMQGVTSNFGQSAQITRQPPQTTPTQFKLNPYYSQPSSSQ